MELNQKKIEIQESIAMRIRASARRMSEVEHIKLTNQGLLLMMVNGYVMKKICKTTTGIPFNGWNCEEILQQNLTLAKIARSHILDII
ncbi:unnamed protein product [Dracunculus medinensis]|uniref:Transcriptional regulator n=1 Tax=Dracunculus medinensis TaxID=318479 RepID=A0A0N4UMR6_DRAME|nr:unnamed protein product [Dracunculus medinensis]